MLRITLRRHDLAAEVYHIKEPVILPLTLSQEEARRLLTCASGLRLRVMLALAYGCGLARWRGLTRAASTVHKASSE